MGTNNQNDTKRKGESSSTTDTQQTKTILNQTPQTKTIPNQIQTATKTTSGTGASPLFPHFLTMSSRDKGKKTSELSPILLRKGIQGIAGEVKSVKPMRSGVLLIEVYRRQQAVNLMGTSSFAGLNVEVKPHASLNSSKGVIRCPALKNDSEADILEYFQHVENIHVSEVRRIRSRRNGQTINTNTFILTFGVPQLPQTVTIGYQRYGVSAYIPNPLRCRNCQKYGHHEDRCGRNTVCEHCGREGHTDNAQCNIVGKRCINCQGNHAASSRDCPAWKKEREVLRVKYTENISFPEARRIVESKDSTNPTFAHNC
ncbi:uncharacterized protein LOC117330192 [Pecten maximus]|uniref:uncharacterized protein LOC117330192 n=1 Tax=Pecten maximus TaxID=6579 RepID=UPI001458863F|nr:uncharacterized protein LOC117330192 [Pecten maximus]